MVRLALLFGSILLTVAAPARAFDFANDLIVERFSISGAVTFSDEFGDGVFPGADWFQNCGSASESGGALAVESTGPGCPIDVFAASVLDSFVAPVVVTADFNLPLPAENEFVGIQINNVFSTDFFSLTTFQDGGNRFVAIRDENGFVSGALDPGDLPSSFFTFQIALATGIGGTLVPTALASVDGNPLFSIEFADRSLDPTALIAGDSYFAQIIAGPVFPVPEPSVLTLVALGLAALVARRSSGIR